jgi:SMC interacting uncharacterized protein involved in chromosome segregation
MSKEKLERYIKYANELESRVSNKEIPSKHKHRPNQYKEFLDRELKAVKKKLEALAYSVPAKK